MSSSPGASSRAEEEDNIRAARERIVFPLDFATLTEAEAFAPRVAPYIGVFKVGLELFVKEGPAAVRQFVTLGRDIFLDLKLHDIPQTVESAVRSSIRLGARYLTVHAAGGREMLSRAVKAAELAESPLTILAVTVLTSLDSCDLSDQAIKGTTSDHVERLAHLAFDAGVRGFVASPVEASMLRSRFGKDVLIVTPGIRPAGAGQGDQKRIATPASAIAAGSDLLVVGRPIREASDPVLAATAIAQEVARVLP